VNVFIDATTLIALGEISELDLLTSFDGELRIPESVDDEVTTIPAEENLQRFVNQNQILTPELPGSLPRGLRETKEKAERILDEDGINGDVVILMAVLGHKEGGNDVALVSDDHRLRTVAEGLGARVTGTIGVVVRAVAEGRLTEEEAKDLVRRLDSRGLHMTGELREKADELIEDAARASEDED
jgi:predicted nucleic acid-binding protein